MAAAFLRGIQGRLNAFYVVLTITALSALTVLFYQVMWETVSASIRSHLQTIAQSRTDLISRWMDEREHDVEVLAQNRAVRAFVIELIAAPDAERERDLVALMRLMRDQYGAYHSIKAIDADGRLLAATSVEADENVEPKLLGRITSGHGYVSAIKRHENSPSLLLDIAAPVPGTDGAALGAIVATVDLEVVNQMTDSMRLMESGEAYLVDRRGVFITHRDRRRVFRDQIADVHGVAEVIGGRTGVGEYVDYRGIRVLGAYQWLPRWQWGLLAEVDTSEAFAPVHTARRNLLLFVVLVALASLLGAATISRRTVRPLQDLTKAVQAVAAGKMDQRLAVAGPDEVAYLSECFNEMTRALERARADIEDRIHDATRDLEKKNEQLERANKALEEQRNLVARSERLAALGEMAAGIAHEINNPLTTMKNLVFSLKAGLPQHDVRQRDISIVAEEIDKINKLVRSFLNYARPTKACVTSFDLTSLVKETMSLVVPQAREKQIRVDLASQENMPPIAADREQIGQVVLNLLLNAIQASPEHREIRVACRAVHAGSRPSRIELTVTDQGPGISDEHRDEVFRPFFTTKSKGSGLGLAVSQRIVEYHDGEISFHSGASEGTTFSVALPLEVVDDDPDPHS